MSKSFSARWSALSIFLMLGWLLILTGCGDSDSSPTASGQSSSVAGSSETAVAPAAHSVASDKPRKKATSKTAERAPRNPHERPIPAFSGRTLDGQRLAMSDLLGARVVLFFFDPSQAAQAAPVAEAVNRVAAVSGDFNFRVVGIGIGSDRDKIARFAAEAGIQYPVIDDSAGEISRKLRLQTRLAILGVDAEGYMGFGFGGFPSEGEVADIVEGNLRQSLRLPGVQTSTGGELVYFPPAPALGVKALSNGSILETDELEGQASVVIFFLHTCPHCHHALGALRTMIDGMPDDAKPRLVAVSVRNDPGAVRTALRDLGLDFFDPYLDPSGEAAERWGVTGGVPVVLVLDSQNRIRHRSTGWDERRDAGLIRMRLAQAAGAPVPMLLDPKGYSGNDVCGVCHVEELGAWQYTQHSRALDTLVTHAADRRTDCIDCHVVGFGEPGGYDFQHLQPHLENVGCESCHGRGGPHLSPDFVKGDDYETVCQTCHNPTHSLGFEYASFHERVSHKKIAALSNSDRAGLLDGAGPDRDLLPSQARFVGSDACQSCHAKEFETWQASPHAKSIASLEAKGKAADAECLACHTTGFGKQARGGFPSGAAVSAHPDLARVGCESCHGAGGDHVGPDAARIGTIVSLGDKCDSCAILKICGSCHDAANDPGFDFEVEDRIEAQRHGTIEASILRGGAAFHAPVPGHDPSDPFHRTDPSSGDAGRGVGDHALLDHLFEQLAHPAATDANG